jgi:pilus assembly protein CpaB
MDRRFLTVLGVSLLFALVVSSIFYQITARAGARRTDSGELRDIVVAAKPLGVGITVKPADVKVIKVPTAQFPRQGFSKVEEVLDRPVVSNILLDEPLLEGRLASRGSGLGIAPIIPVGMRAVTVRVNDVVGVAGFVMPGMRVDVLVTGRPPGQDGSFTTTALQNILVLTAGTTIEPDARGQAINAPNVTLLVTPDQAEILTLASNEGKIQLVLRNGGDQSIERTQGRRIYELFGGTPKAEPRGPAQAPRPRPKPVEVAQAAPAPPPPPPAPPVDQIVVIRGNQKSVETVLKNN